MSVNGLEKLLSPCNLYKLNLKNRLFMSSMNRCRADNKFKATPIMKVYYCQRSNAGLIFSEPLYVAREGITRENVSGLWSDEFIDNWRRIVDGVHEREGVIFATLSHGGRTSHSLLNGGKQPLCASAVKADIQITFRNENFDMETPKEMDQDDIQRVYDQFHSAAIRAKKIGFDGVSLHATSGSLPETFIKSNTNLRTDYYGGGGGLEFITQILSRFRSEFDEKYISIKINPFDRYNDMYEINPLEKYIKLITKIHKESPIGSFEFKELIEKGRDGHEDFQNNMEETKSRNIKKIAKAIAIEIRKKSLLISNFGTKDINDAIRKMEKDTCDYVSLATFYVSNPDLPQKLRKNMPIVLPDEKMYYTHGDEGYIDYE